MVDDSSFKIPEAQFKIAIVSSLPPSWDSFTQPYISIYKGDHIDPKIQATSQELIGILKEEYVRHLRRSGKLEKQETVHQANAPKTSLANHLTDAEKCGHCGMRNHKTQDCCFLGQSECGICDRFGHKTKDCYSKKAKELKRKREDKGDGKGKKSRRKGGNYSKTPESERRHIAMVVLRENLTLEKASIRFGMSRQTINRWVHLFYDEIEQTKENNSLNLSKKKSITVLSFNILGRKIVSIF